MLQMSRGRSAAVFYVLAIVGSTAAAATGASTTVAMLVPTVATFIMLLVVTSEGWHRQGWQSLGLHRAGWSAWPLALGLPLIIAAVGIVAAVSTSDVHWHITGQAAAFSPWLWPGILLVNIAYATVTVSLTEEIGWRGYLLPRLTQLGVRRALLVSGVMHGAWHLPVILLTDLYHPAGSRWVVVPTFMVLLTAVGVFLGWLRLQSDSVWPPVLAHSANNVAAMWMIDVIDGDPTVIQYLADEGIIAAIAYVAVAALILLTAHRTAQLTTIPTSALVTART